MSEPAYRLVLRGLCIDCECREFCVIGPNHDIRIQPLHYQEICSCSHPLKSHTPAELPQHHPFKYLERGGCPLRRCTGYEPVDGIYGPQAICLCEGTWPGHGRPAWRTLNVPTPASLLPSSGPSSIAAHYLPPPVSSFPSMSLPSVLSGILQATQPTAPPISEFWLPSTPVGANATHTTSMARMAEAHSDAARSGLNLARSSPRPRPYPTTPSSSRAPSSTANTHQDFLVVLIPTLLSPSSHIPHGVPNIWKIGFSAPSLPTLLQHLHSCDLVFSLAIVSTSSSEFIERLDSAVLSHLEHHSIHFPSCPSPSNPPTLSDRVWTVLAPKKHDNHISLKPTNVITDNTFTVPTLQRTYRAYPCPLTLFPGHKLIILCPAFGLVTATLNVSQRFPLPVDAECPHQHHACWGFRVLVLASLEPHVPADTARCLQLCPAQPPPLLPSTPPPSAVMDIAPVVPSIRRRVEDPADPLPPPPQFIEIDDSDEPSDTLPHGLPPLDSDDDMPMSPFEGILPCCPSSITSVTPQGQAVIAYGPRQITVFLRHIAPSNVSIASLGEVHVTSVEVGARLFLYILKRQAGRYPPSFLSLGDGPRALPAFVNPMGVRSTFVDQPLYRLLRGTRAFSYQARSSSGSAPLRTSLHCALALIETDKAPMEIWSRSVYGDHNLVPEFSPLSMESMNPERLLTLAAHTTLLAVHMVSFGQAIVVNFWLVLLLVLGENTFHLSPDVIRIIDPGLAHVLDPWLRLGSSDALDASALGVLHNYGQIPPDSIPTSHTGGVHMEVIGCIAFVLVFGSPKATVVSSPEVRALCWGLNVPLGPSRNFITELSSHRTFDQIALLISSMYRVHQVPVNMVLEHLWFTLQPAALAHGDWVQQFSKVFKMRVRSFLSIPGHPQSACGTTVSVADFDKETANTSLRASLLLQAFVGTPSVPIEIIDWSLERFSPGSARVDRSAHLISFHSCFRQADVKINMEVVELLFSENSVPFDSDDDEAEYSPPATRSRPCRRSHGQVPPSSTLAQPLESAHQIDHLPDPNAGISSTRRSARTSRRPRAPDSPVLFTPASVPHQTPPPEQPAIPEAPPPEQQAIPVTGSGTALEEPVSPQHINPQDPAASALQELAQSLGLSQLAHPPPTQDLPSQPMPPHSRPPALPHSPTHQPETIPLSVTVTGSMDEGHSLQVVAPPPSAAMDAAEPAGSATVGSRIMAVIKSRLYEHVFVVTDPSPTVAPSLNCVIQLLHGAGSSQACLLASISARPDCMHVATAHDPVPLQQLFIHGLQHGFQEFGYLSDLPGVVGTLQLPPLHPSTLQTRLLTSFNPDSTPAYVLYLYKEPLGDNDTQPAVVLPAMSPNPLLERDLYLAHHYGPLRDRYRDLLCCTSNTLWKAKSLIQNWYGHHVAATILQAFSMASALNATVTVPGSTSFSQGNILQWLELSQNQFNDMATLKNKTSTAVLYLEGLTHLSDFQARTWKLIRMLQNPAGAVMSGPASGLDVRNYELDTDTRALLATSLSSFAGDVHVVYTQATHSRTQ
ncbi:unnamed protein product [Cyclocybe aegerita]|uniref:Uncharacterized protein n=1 Tax=Cyclocybe aegerita TaxID=1973307 RepID=A0A8S0Y0W6_CYCAE|nr:unnamed protein product [Cyclocybe aegerita]